MKAFLDRYRKLLVLEIDAAFARNRKIYTEINPWGKETADRLGAFGTKGKLIRGSLVLFSSEMFGTNASKDTIKAAAAIEIIHSSLLVHDDIMDNDSLRRGQPSMHKQFETIAKSQKHISPPQIGVSLALCAGDVGFFLAWEILGKLQNPRFHDVLQKIGREISLVAIAQMQDVAPYANITLTEKDILHKYQYKTGRYSFSLPLAVGAILADQSPPIIRKIELLGEHLGIIFQLSDDMLGLFGTSEQTGKIIGSDVKENKQTLYKALLFQKASPEEIKKLNRLFGNSEVKRKDIVYIQTLIMTYAIDKDINNLSEKYAQKARKIIVDLPIESIYKSHLKELLQHLQDLLKQFS